jgi:hypothetical protein
MALLNIPDETYAELSAQAAARQLLVEQYVLPLLAQPKPEPQLPLTGAAWDAAMDELDREAQSRDGRYPPGFVLDDSRETMYFGGPEGRG